MKRRMKRKPNLKNIRYIHIDDRTRIFRVFKDGVQEFQLSIWPLSGKPYFDYDKYDYSNFYYISDDENNDLANIKIKKIKRKK